MEKSKNTKAHLTLDDRMEIQQRLNYGVSFKAIVKRLGKDPTTISKEVKRSFIIKPTTTTRKGKTGKVIIGVCPLWLKAPFVCNSCKKRILLALSIDIYITQNKLKLVTLISTYVEVTLSNMLSWLFCYTQKMKISLRKPAKTLFCQT